MIFFSFEIKLPIPNLQLEFFQEYSKIYGESLIKLVKNYLGSSEPQFQGI